MSCPAHRVRVLPFGRSTSTKNPGELECDVQIYAHGQAALVLEPKFDLTGILFGLLT
jgi:hypothetical protein